MRFCLAIPLVTKSLNYKETISLRPDILFPLYADVTSLAGIGPRLGKLLEKLTGPHLVDVLWHLPREMVTRRRVEGLIMAQAGELVTVRVTVDHHIPSRDKKRPYRIICGDSTGEITLTFFHADRRYLETQLPQGEERLISGRIEFYGQGMQMAHPDYIVLPEKEADIPVHEAVYPLTTGLTPKVLAKAIHGSMAKIPELQEWIDPEFLKRNQWPSWKEAIEIAHNPKVPEDLSADQPARARLAYDELLANQLALAIMRQVARSNPGRRFNGNGAFRRRALATLPFQLTNAQMRALKEIDEDMTADRRMLRLLQGDVGSGKTVVALMAALNAAECGAQAAIMAPTEILAQQHLETIAPILEQSGLKQGGINVVLLTGRSKGKARNHILDQIRSGQARIIIGTHALFQDDVVYQDLALCVIDEQHRFGVQQRIALSSKGRAVDMLVMTATPIPRTLMMSAYGDLDNSRLNEKPAGRKPIQTVVVSQERMDEVLAGLNRKLKMGAQVYWVCPLVDESEVLDLAAAEERFTQLQGLFGDNQVALVHGKMKATEKDKGMARFVEGDARILVATTVIEVGVNVPSATVMVIEHAERFGLAQLHQLRGRIGRGSEASTCLLLRSNRVTDVARERLKIMSETEDGFIISEKDLELRGAGEILGTRQSGLPEMKLANMSDHKEWMQAAYDDARLILARDEKLKSDRGKALKILLYLFGRDMAVGNLKSG